MSESKKFNVLALFFAPAYYAGYGKVGKGVVFAIIGFLPITAIAVNIYAAFRANRDLPVKQVPFNWLFATLVLILSGCISAGAFYVIQQRNARAVDSSISPPTMNYERSSENNGGEPSVEDLANNPDFQLAVENCREAGVQEAEENSPRGVSAQMMDEIAQECLASVTSEITR